MGLHHDVCVGRFSVYVCADATIGQALQMDVEEGNGFIHFLFPRELYPRVDGIEAVVEISTWVRSSGVVAAAEEAGTTWRWLVVNDTPAVIHVNGHMTRWSNASLLSYVNGPLHGMYHPQLGNTNHETEANWRDAARCK
jgi:hypothetical protein